MEWWTREINLSILIVLLVHDSPPKVVGGSGRHNKSTHVIGNNVVYSICRFESLLNQVTTLGTTMSARIPDPFHSCQASWVNGFIPSKEPSPK
jgi:hypothetical protein